MATSRTRKRRPLPASDLIPVQIIWQGPEATRVVLDEDGVNLRFANGGGLEEYDLDRLLAIIREAKRAVAEYYGDVVTVDAPF